MGHEKDFGGFLGATFELLSKNAAALLIFIALIGGANAAGLIFGLIEQSDNLFDYDFGFSIESASGIAAGIYQLGIAVLTIVAAYFFMSHLLAGEGRLRDSGTRIWAYVGLVILSGLAMVLGFLLLIIPGIILVVRWSAATGFLIGTQNGVIDSMKESWEATRGYSWPIFFVGLVLLVGLIVIAGIIGGAAAFLGSSALIAILASAFDALGSALFYAFGIAVFLSLHDDSDEIGEVFS